MCLADFRTAHRGQNPLSPDIAELFESALTFLQKEFSEKPRTREFQFHEYDIYSYRIIKRRIYAERWSCA